MKRRDALKRLAAGAGSTFALVGAASAESNPVPKELQEADVWYRVTEQGVEEVEPDAGYCEENPECCPYDCCDCPYDCYDGCRCADPC